MVINSKYAHSQTTNPDPEGNLHRQLEPGILNIIKAPHKPGNQPVTPYAWGEYKPYARRKASTFVRYTWASDC